MENINQVSAVAEMVEGASRINSMQSSIGLPGLIHDTILNGVNIPDEFVSGENDSRLAKVIATAINIAQETGCAEPELADLSEYGVASVADDVTARIQLSNKLERGEIEIEEVLDRLVDKSSARLIVFAKSAVEKAMGMGVDKMCQIMVLAYPPAAAVVPVIKVASQFLKTKVQTAVSRGIERVADYSKRAIPTILNKVNTAVSKIKQKLWSLSIA